MILRRRFAVLLLPLLVALDLAHAEEAAPIPPPYAVPPDAPLTWRQVGRDAHYVFSRPAHLDRTGWIKLACGIAVGASLYLVRDDVRQFAQDHGSETTDQILQRARLMSRTATPILASAGFYFAGVARDSGYDKETATLLLENLFYASAITGAAQRVLVTERPRKGDDVDVLQGHDGHSVSGDVTVAASMLAPIIDRHLHVDGDDGRGVRFWKRCGAVALYGGAGLVALQRINVDAHWAPDVYFGYLNGLAIGRLLVDGRRGGREPGEGRPQRRVEVTPTVAGLRITWR